MMRDLLKLDMHTSKICVGVASSYCCDASVIEKDRFKINIIREGDSSGTVLIEYPMFDINVDDQMCVLLDDEMGNLCKGRYLLTVVLDECTVIGSLRFIWGGTPIIKSVSVDEYSLTDCVEDCVTKPKLPATNECCTQAEQPTSCAELNSDCGC